MELELEELTYLGDAMRWESRKIWGPVARIDGEVVAGPSTDEWFTCALGVDDTAIVDDEW